MNRRVLLLLMLGLVGVVWFAGGHFLNWQVGIELPLLGFVGVDLLGYSGLIVGVFAVLTYHWLSKKEST